jgi:predicted permease
MNRAAGPSPFAERLLTLIVRDEEQRDSIVGDLREEFARLAARKGVDAAAHWHARQSLNIACRYGVRRALRRQPPQRWIAMASLDVDRPARWSGLSRDVRYAWRAISQRRLLSMTVAATLALALAANSTTFSLLDALVLRPYRFPGVDRLLVVTTVAPNESLFDRNNVSAGDFREWQAQSKTTSAWAMYQWWDANLSGVDIPEQVAGFKVSPGFFKLLNAPPVMGREFVDAEAQPGQHRRVVLGHALWTRRFAADPAIVGKSVRFDGEPYEVVGVAAPGFHTPDGAEVWGALALDDTAWNDRRSQAFGAFARLADGASVESARSELTTIVDNQRRDHPDTNIERQGKVLSFTAGMADPGAGPFVGIWQAAALLLLLIACANIANLLMARGAERTAEYSLRLALGASRGRLFGQTVLEGLLLSTLAVVLSMPLIAIGLGLSRASIPAPVLRFIPGWEFIRIDLTLFAATALLGTVAMMLFSLLPAFQATRAQVADTLRQSGRSLTPGRNRQWLRSVLATTQIALALALLFASVLALTAANQTVNGVLGFDKNNVLVAQLNLPERSYADAEVRRRFVSDVSDAMRAIPAVTTIGATSIIPAAFNNSSRRIFPEGRQLTEAEARYAEYRRATPDYFAALHIALLRGRLFDAGDRDLSTPVAIVSAAFAHRYWGDDDPLGKRFKTGVNGEWLTVVGVVGNVVHNWFVRQNDAFYRPLTQDAPYSVAFAVRTVGDPTALAGDLRRAIARVDADQPIASLQTLDGLVEERAAGFMFIARALAVVGAIALVLSMMGIYSLMAFLTSQRTQEIGVRMALGAGRWQVVRATTRRALGITIVGAAAGSILAFLAGRVMQTVMFGLIENNTLQLAGLTAILAAAALLAAYFPARRAAALDPMTALRQP